MKMMKEDLKIEFFLNHVVKNSCLAPAGHD